MPNLRRELSLCPSACLSVLSPVLAFPGTTRLQPEDPPQLLRTRSDVGVRRRGSSRTPSEQRRIRRHRFSINGHFYNHKVRPTGTVGGVLVFTHWVTHILCPTDICVHTGVRLHHQRADKQHNDNPTGAQAAAQQVQGKSGRSLHWV